MSNNYVDVHGEWVLNPRMNSPNGDKRNGKIRAAFVLLLSGVPFLGLARWFAGMGYSAVGGVQVVCAGIPAVAFTVAGAVALVAAVGLAAMA